MEKFVINIGRQVGSGGRSVGEILARRLGVRLYDRELINLAAEEYGLHVEWFERADERGHGVLAPVISYLRSALVDDGSGIEGPLSPEALFKVQSEVIREIAARESAVFVGRCADYVLRDHPACLNLFLTADEPDRLARLCPRWGLSSGQARERMLREDAGRAAYYNYYGSRTWGDAATYHLCLNTSVLGVEQTADFVLEFAARKLHMNF